MIGTRIRNRRIELGLTQDDLAKRMGYTSRSTINKIENNINDIPQSKVIKFAEALGTTAADLMGWTSDDPGINEIADVIANHEQGMSLQERQIIEAYRNADDLTQQMVLRLLKVGE